MGSFTLQFLAAHLLAKIETIPPTLCITKFYDFLRSILMGLLSYEPFAFQNGVNCTHVLWPGKAGGLRYIVCPKMPMRPNSHFCACSTQIVCFLYLLLSHVVGNARGYLLVKLIAK